MNEVTKYNLIPRYETQALAEYFSDMSAKGLFLYKLNNWLEFDFIQETPKRIFYTVDLFKPNKNQSSEEYIELCESSGWKFVDSDKDNHIYVFSTEDENTTPIQTDKAIEMFYLKKIAKRRLFHELLSVGVYILFTALQLNRIYNDPLEVYQNNFVIVTFVVYYIAMIFYLFFHFMLYKNCITRIKALKCTTKAKKISYKTIINIKKYMYLFLAVALVLFFFAPSILSILNPKDSLVENTPFEIQNFKFDNLNNMFEKTYVYSSQTSLLIPKNYFIITQDETSKLNYIHCNLNYIATDIYNRINVLYIDDWNYLTKEQCVTANVDQGKYFYIYQTLIIVLQKDNTIIKLQLYGYASPNDNILSELNKIK